MLPICCSCYHFILSICHDSVPEGLSSFVIRHSSFVIPHPRPRRISWSGRKLVSAGRPWASESWSQSKRTKQTGVARPPPAVRTASCQRVPQPRSGLWPVVSSRSKVMSGTPALAARPKITCAKTCSRKISSRLEVDRQPRQEQRQHADAQGIDREGIQPKPAANGYQGNGGRTRAQTRIDHQRRQQVNLRAQQLAQAAERRLPKHRQVGRPEQEDGGEPGHLSAECGVGSAE